MSAPVTDPVEELLAAALADARTDDRWGIAPQAKALTSVRRAATRQRTRNAGLALAAVAGTTAGLSVLAGHGPATQTIVQQPGDGAASPQPVAGISPEWIPQSGSDWVLDKPAYDDFVASHVLPSPAPHTVRSPAPLTPVSARLERDVLKALPGASTVRQDAPDGLAGAAAIHAKLPDGTAVEIRRELLQQPIPTRYLGQEEARLSRRDLASGSVLMVGDGAGHFAYTVTSEGVQTSWYAADSVPVTTLAGWAEAADRD